MMAERRGRRSGTSSPTTGPPARINGTTVRSTPGNSATVWHLEPSLTDPNTVYAGVEDAALFRSADGGQTWKELPGLREVKGHLWAPGAGGMGLHTIVLDPGDPQRMYIAISAAGAFRTGDGGMTWTPINRGLQSLYELPDPDAEVGHCVHRIAMHPSRANVLFMQKHWDVLRTDDGGDSWHEVSGNLPSDFGFFIDVHAHEPETIYVVPIKSDSEHSRPTASSRVYRSRTGGDEWEALTNGLPQQDCYVNVLRDAMAVNRWSHVASTSGPRADRCTPPPTAGTAGCPSCAICLRCCQLRCRRWHDPCACHHLQQGGAGISSGDPAGAPAEPGARVWKRSVLTSNRPSNPRAVLDALEARYPQLRGTTPTT